MVIMFEMCVGGGGFEMTGGLDGFQRQVLMHVYC